MRKVISLTWQAHTLASTQNIQMEARVILEVENPNNMLPILENVRSELENSFLLVRFRLEKIVDMEWNTPLPLAYIGDIFGKSKLKMLD